MESQNELTDVDYLGLCLSSLHLQVVHPHLPLGQLDSAVGEGIADGCHRALLAVSVRHTGPQQLGPNQHRSISGLSDPDRMKVVMNQKPPPDDSSVTPKSAEESDWSDTLNDSRKRLETSSGRFHNLYEVRIDSK